MGMRRSSVGGTVQRPGRACPHKVEGPDLDLDWGGEGAVERVHPGTTPRAPLYRRSASVVVGPPVRPATTLTAPLAIAVLTSDCYFFFQNSSSPVVGISCC